MIRASISVGRRRGAKRDRLRGRSRFRMYILSSWWRPLVTNPELLISHSGGTRLVNSRARTCLRVPGFVWCAPSIVSLLIPAGHPGASVVAKEIRIIRVRTFVEKSKHSRILGRLSLAKRMTNKFEPWILMSVSFSDRKKTNLQMTDLADEMDSA